MRDIGLHLCSGEGERDVIDLFHLVLFHLFYLF